MSEHIIGLLSRVEVGEPSASAGLQVFGLRLQDRSSLNYATLDEVLAAELADVTEVSEGGAVPELKVVNKGDTMLLLMAGEQLIGAKQNRALNASIMVAAHSEQLIPVSCTEMGRWAYKSRKFWSSGTSSHSNLRAMLAKQVHQSYRSQRGPRSDQGGVWNEVAAKLARMESYSDSGALEKAYEDHQAKLKEIMEHVGVPEGCSGAVFAVNSRILGADVFDKPATLAKLWPKLIRSYALDAIEPSQGEHAPVTRDAVREWLRRAMQGKMEPFKSVGLGDDIRIEAQEIVGAGLVVDDQPVHVEVFAEAAAAQGLHDA
jgi:hypothetical protein